VVMRVRLPHLPLVYPDGEMDNRTSLRTRSSGFDSWSGFSLGGLGISGCGLVVCDLQFGGECTLEREAALQATWVSSILTASTEAAIHNAQMVSVV
jgi:hypothetical protein